eukprot:g7999.t1
MLALVLQVPEGDTTPSRINGFVQGHLRRILSVNFHQRNLNRKAVELLAIYVNFPAMQRRYFEGLLRIRTVRGFYGKQRILQICVALSEL